MVKQTALGIAIQMLQERIEHLLNVNEGFDGEISAEDLATMALESFGKPPVRLTRENAVGGVAVNPHLAARAARAYGARKQTECKYCGATDVKWSKGERGWTLLNPNGDRHLCRRHARQSEQAFLAAHDDAAEAIAEAKIEAYLNRK